MLSLGGLLPFADSVASTYCSKDEHNLLLDICVELSWVAIQVLLCSHKTSHPRDLGLRAKRGKRLVPVNIVQDTSGYLSL